MTEAPQSPKICPICGKQAAGKFKPFCSSRCSALDLGKWLGDAYKIETGENGNEETSLTRG